jgi:hypothetical protein
MIEISKSDWKKYREKISGWQESYMERLLKAYVDYLNSDRSASEKFWELEKRIKQDRKCPGVLVEMRKSSAVFDIANMITDDVIKMEDLDEFSDELKENIKFILGSK